MSGRAKARRGSLLLPALLLLLSTGCATPVGVEKVGLREAYRDIDASALTRKEPGEDTKAVLHRYGLSERFGKDPGGALAVLTGKALGEDDRRDLRFALSELWFLHAEGVAGSGDEGERRKAPDLYLTSAVSAMAFLLGESREPAPSPYDRRFRVACDLYNRSLGKALATGEGGTVELKEGVRTLPAGPLALSVDARALPWPPGTFEKFLLADDYAVRGLTVRNRTPGLGVPLIAVTAATKESPRGIALPVTAFLRVSAAAGDNGARRFEGTLSLHATHVEGEAEARGRRVPLESDSTAPIAWMLEDPSVWKAGARRFLKLEERVEPGIRPVEPYVPGRVPVVFVHGTASSPVRWAEMINTLRGDPVLGKRCQFWFFRYNSSVPVTLSAAELRRSLAETVRKLDPEGKDPALKRVVVIGHSQGGLLTKMAVVRTGDRLWRSLSDEPWDEARFDPKLKERVREALFIEPLPFVTRVVFISTPHRGSFLATGTVRNLVRRFVTLPQEVARAGVEVLRASGSDRLPAALRGKIPTAVDGMSPDNPVLKALVETPLEPGVKAHSIIPVEGDGDYRAGNDGVVEYGSAHLEGVESELVVRDGHSCQGNPVAIEEVRRILLLHTSAD